MLMYKGVPRNQSCLPCLLPEGRPTAIIDFETRATIDIRKHDAWRYASHPKTEVMCLGYQIDPVDPARIWLPGQPFPVSLREHILNGGLVEAHNYFFEWAVWRHRMVPYTPDCPPIPFEQWRCTAALAARHNLPRGLDGVCSALQLPVQKDKEGHRLMLRMSKPRKPTKDNPAVWHEDPKDLERLYEYCKQDVLAERCVAEELGELEPRELALWQFTERLNQRGVHLDLDFAKSAVAIFDKCKEDGNIAISKLTRGAVKTTGQIKEISNWCERQGVTLNNLQKETVKEVVRDKATPALVRKVLNLRLQLGKNASISKYTAMLNKADLGDGQLRNHVRYSGAGPGRWAGRGVQTHNLVRKMNLLEALTLKRQAAVLKSPAVLRHIYPDITQRLSSAVRPTFVARPGKLLGCVDFSSIEARVLAWFADDPNLEIFRAGKDIYCEMASLIYKKPINKKDHPTERDLGKEAELACGYQLWWKTLLVRCWGNGVKVAPELAYETVKLYRNKHPKVQEFWYAIETAMMESVLYNKVTTLGSLAFEPCRGNVDMVLPSGRHIVFNNPSVKKKKRAVPSIKKLRSDLKQLGTPKDMIDVACDLSQEEAKKSSGKERQVVCYYREDSSSWKWKETSTYGGQLTENACQGMASDVLSEASLSIGEDPERFGHAVMTVHDELVCEQDEDKVDIQGMIDEMCKVPSWAKGLPLAGEGWVGKEYRK